MENFLDILKQICFFLNSYWFPLSVAIVCIVAFAIVYFKANQMVNKYRREFQQKIVNEANAEHKKEQEKTSPSQDKRN